jgi:AmmeMemoRadiSam system protein B
MTGTRVEQSLALEGSFPLVLLVPHGAAADSFPVAAHAYSELASVVAKRPITTVLFIGNNHRKPGLALSDMAWKTPLGELEPESELIAALVSAAGGQHMTVDNADHEREHSLENQLPLLQMLFEQCGSPPRVVALSVGYQAFCSADGAAAMARMISSALSQTSGRCGEHSWAATTAIIGTTDYTHAGPGYRELPPECTEPAGGWSSADGQRALIGYARARDKPVLDAILGGGAGAASVVRAGRGTSMCGLWAAALTLEVSNAVGLTQRRLLKYAVSAEVSPHLSGNVTGFAAVAMTPE